MKSNKLFSILSLVIIFFGIIGLAVARKALGNKHKEDGRSELRKLFQHYINADSIYTINGTIQIFDGELKDHPLKEQNSFESKKDSKNFYFRIASQETIVDGNYVVQLDTLNKTLIIEKMDSAIKYYLAKRVDLIPFEKYLSDTSAFKIAVDLEKEGNMNTLFINNELTPEIKSAKITYEANSYKLIKSELEIVKNESTYFSDNNKCWLSKINYNMQSFIPIKIQDRMYAIFKIVNGKVKVQNQYLNYHITIKD